MDFLENLLKDEFLIMALIGTLGYALGRIHLCGLSLGTSGILMIALLFGHFGLMVPAIVRNLGLIVFVTAVGLIAGPVFFQSFKQKAVAYILLGLVIVATGGICAILTIYVFNVPTNIAVGMFTGALTSTPGLAAATELLGDAAAIGYGIAYPFGVIAVVMFVQLVPKLLKVDMSKEVERLNCTAEKEKRENIEEHGSCISMDAMGLFIFCLTIALGMLLAKISVPLQGGMFFNLGTSGGPLMAGLLIGHLARVGSFSLRVPQKVLEILREIGLILFLMGTGTQAGQGFLEILKEQGFCLFFYGALITLTPMILGYFFARRVFRLDLITTLGSVTGGMTSTPALGALVMVSGTSNVATAYAATYPISLISVVVFTQLICLYY